MPFCRRINENTLVVIMVSAQWGIQTTAHASTGARESLPIWNAYYIQYMPVCSWTRGHISRNTVLKCSPWRAAARLLFPDECEDKSIAPTSGSLVAESSSIIRWSRGDRCVETHMHTHSHWQWPPRDHHLHAKASDISPRCPAPRETHPSASLHVSHRYLPVQDTSYLYFLSPFFYICGFPL